MSCYTKLVMEFQIFTIFMGFSFIICKKLSKPEPHNPLEPIVYPEDYCSQWNGQIKFDYVVIGAGPAGATLSRRLAEDKNVEVLLLEAGGNPPTSSDIPTNIIYEPAAIWNITTIPKENQCQGYPGNVCTYLYVKYLGGCSVTNLMMYTRGNHKDFDDWKRTGCPGWGWNDIFPYFLKLENFVDVRHQLHPDKKFHHEGGPFTTSPSQDDPLTFQFHQDFKKSLLNREIPENNDPNGKRQNGVGPITISMESTGYRNNVAKSYLLHIPDNLHICKYSTVHKLQISEDKTVTGVEFVYNNTNKMVARATKEYIVSAGPISSPQILERSGIGRMEVLEKAGVQQTVQLDGVGENLFEQFANIGCAFTLNLNNSVYPNLLSLATVPLALFLNLDDYSDEVPEMQWIFSTLTPDMLPNFKPELAQQYAKLMQTGYLLFTSPIILRQSNTGFVHIAGMDPLQSPLFQPNQYTTASEKRTLGKGCRLIRDAMKDPILSVYNPQPVVLNECKGEKFNTDDEIMCQAGLVSYPLYHLAGTTKMGPKSDKMAVVDPKLKVYGVDKLRIVDLGVMPFVTRANTEIPTIAVAEMAADIIKKEYRSKKRWLFW